MGELAAVTKDSTGVKCMFCGKFVVSDFAKHAAFHKSAVRAGSVKWSKSEPVEILFVEYVSGEAVGRKLF